ncbi:hypothetical protein GMRT_11476 [Giardia muris]|uniref:Uncharacterized protein n=1 Tax=Giardia muris TaxID=5742 RepID=A0A4Z1SVZ5_GIAMU|nr:hypothetical protein GMRT_11476 [Giardia muris]|eukprot:TNJ29780.1 hypothetical protein GMRT_11476 [Giardia muris]
MQTPELVVEEVDIEREYKDEIAGLQRALIDERRATAQLRQRVSELENELAVLKLPASCPQCRIYEELLNEIHEKAMPMHKGRPMSGLATGPRSRAYPAGLGHDDLNFIDAIEPISPQHRPTSTRRGYGQGQGQRLSSRPTSARRGSSAKRPLRSGSAKRRTGRSPGRGSQGKEKGKSLHSAKIAGTLGHGRLKTGAKSSGGRNRYSF